MISLSGFDLAVTAVLVIVLAVLAFRLHLGLAGQLLVAGTRMIVQLVLLGLVLKAVFGYVHVALISAIAVVMLLFAGREVSARQKLRLSGWWSFGIGTGAMFVSSFVLMFFSLAVVVAPEPWYHPQYAVPMLGMLLGNTMNAVALGLDRLLHGMWQNREQVEHRLLLGQDRHEATLEVRREAMRAALIPVINMMAAAGLVSLPGMMTGQILAGSPPMEAVKYQIFILLLIAAGAGFASLAAMWLGQRRLFDDRDRLCLDRLVHRES